MFDDGGSRSEFLKSLAEFGEKPVFIARARADLTGNGPNIGQRLLAPRTPMLRTTNAILVASLLFTGCAGAQNASLPDLGGPSGTVTWSASVDNNKPVPGIDQASIYYAGTAFVVWSDFDGGGSGSSSGNLRGVTGQGSVTSRDSRRIDFQFATRDGKTGTVTIHDSQYDLKNGGLFLVSAHDGGLQVKQLQRDLRELRFERASMEAFARNDAEIRSFFSGQ